MHAYIQWAEKNTARKIGVLRNYEDFIYTYMFLPTLFLVGVPM